MNIRITTLSLTLLIVSFVGCNKDVTIQPPNDNVPTTVTYAGKTYHTIKIGSQYWLKENLDVGTMIHGIDTAKNNGIIEKYCYNNDTNNCNTYGALYQWDEAMQYTTTPGTKGICPSGWHLPTRAEYEILIAAVDSNGNAIKAEGQGSGAGAGTNTSGFSALLAGIRIDNGDFDGLGDVANFWSSTEDGAYYACFMYLYDHDSNIFYYYATTKEDGFSVRCVKD
jgi:uncharacterized protein (TIGR02145 family)